MGGSTTRATGSQLPSRSRCPAGLLGLAARIKRLHAREGAFFAVGIFLLWVAGLPNYTSPFCGFSQGDPKSWAKANYNEIKTCLVLIMARTPC